MKSEEAPSLEVRLAGEIGRAWADLGGSDWDAAIAALAETLWDLSAAPGERAPRPGRRRRRREPRR